MSIWCHPFLDNASQIYFCSFALTPGAIGLLYNVKPFKTKLPGYSVLGNTGAGVSLDWLKARQKDWLNKFDWSKEEAAMNKLNHSTVDIGNITVHFVHQRSSDPKAIPVLLTHGWPGSFYKFHNVISPLSNPGGDSNVSFHVVVPLMPGFSISSPAPIGRNINMTADLFNTLLTEVLGYKSYAAAAGDWGSGVNWALQNNHADTLRAVLYDGLIPQLGPSYEQIASGPQFAEDVKNLTVKQKKRINKNADYTTSGNGYFVEHSTRGGHFTGLDNPDALIGDLRKMMGQWYYA
ncbi:hypothetical protein RhiTH_006984 [Rhizoctonia solani]